MTPKRPTLKTISELSGFAVPTVSRALKNAPDIGAETKRKVRQIAADIGYVPNRAGVRLRTGKTNVISLVLATDHDVTDHTGRLIASIAQALRGTGYHMIVTPFSSGEDRMDSIRYVVETGSADAIIINQIEPEDPRVAYMMERGFPFATYGRTDWCRDHPYFDFDNGAFGAIAGKRLTERGRRNVLLVAPPLDQSYTRHMIDGLRGALNAGGAQFEILDGCNSDGTNPEIRSCLSARLRTGGAVDGIVCPSTTAAISSVAALEAFGCALGEDVDVFAKEAIPFLGIFRPQILSVIEDVVAAGQFLAEAAIRAIEHPDLPPMQAIEVAKLPNPIEPLA